MAHPSACAGTGHRTTPRRSQATMAMECGGPCAMGEGPCMSIVQGSAIARSSTGTSCRSSPISPSASSTGSHCTLWTMRHASTHLPHGKIRCAKTEFWLHSRLEVDALRFNTIERARRLSHGVEAPAYSSWCEEMAIGPSGTHCLLMARVRHLVSCGRRRTRRRISSQPRTRITFPWVGHLGFRPRHLRRPTVQR